MNLTTTPAVDIHADLPCKPGYTVNSWFAIGHFQADGHTLDYLVHLMTLSVKGLVVGVDAAASVTDETTGWYGVRHTFTPIFRASARTDRLFVKAGDFLIAGTLDDLRVQARMRDAEIDVTLRNVGHPLYNRDTGRFDMLGMDVFQYSIPTMETTGRLVIEGREFTASGESWFDRQWQNQPLGPPRGRWTWMDLNLSNGWRVSLWDAVGADRRTDSWVTVIDETGAHTVGELVPLGQDAADYWLTAPKGSRFPTRWLVRVPTLGMELTVAATPREQVVRGLSERYEGASVVHGTVRGEPVDGHCYVEMVGDWKA